MLEHEIIDKILKGEVKYLEVTDDRHRKRFQEAFNENYLLIDEKTTKAYRVRSDLSFDATFMMECVKGNVTFEREDEELERELVQNMIDNVIDFSNFIKRLDTSYVMHVEVIEETENPYTTETTKEKS